LGYTIINCNNMCCCRNIIYIDSYFMRAARAAFVPKRIHRIFRMRSESHVVERTQIRGSLIILYRVTAVLSPPENWFVVVRPGNSIPLPPLGAFHYNRDDTPINARGYCVFKCRGMLAPSIARSVPLRRSARVCALGTRGGGGGGKEGG